MNSRFMQSHEHERIDHADRPAISVCACTYQRPRLLASLLTSLVKQSFSGFFEVIVVDNDPTGSAAEIISKVRYEIPVSPSAILSNQKKGFPLLATQQSRSLLAILLRG